MTDKKAATAIGAREGKRAETAGLVARIFHTIGDLAELAGGFVALASPIAGGLTIGGGVLLNKIGDGGADIKSSHEGKSHANDALIAMARGGSPALGMHGVVPAKGIAERTLERFGANGKRSAADVSTARTAAEVKAGKAEHELERSPMTPAAPGGQTPAQTSASHMSDGMTAAYQRRGAHGVITVQGYATPNRK